MNNKLEQLTANFLNSVEASGDDLNFIGIVGDMKTGEILIGELGTPLQIGFMLAVAHKRFAQAFKSRSLEERDAFVDGLIIGKNSSCESAEELKL